MPIDVADIKERASVRFRDIFVALAPDHAILESVSGFNSSCPIHEGGDESHFSWHDGHKFWNCWSDECGRTKDVFDFIQVMAGVSFTESCGLAEKILAKPPKTAPVHKEAPTYEDADLYMNSADLRERIGYVRCGEEGFPEVAREYLVQQRGFSEKLLRERYIGFASKGTLANRIVIPVVGRRDHEGKKIVGCQGRVIGDAPTPNKYLNYGNTPSGGFPVARVLYNMPPRKSSGTVLIVEGPFCVLRALQFGYLDVVALLGSALSARQIELIGATFPAALLALDHDKAQKVPRMKHKLLKRWPTLKVGYFPANPKYDIAAMAQSEFQDRLQKAMKGM